MIVVAVPTKNSDAFSSPEAEGWSLISLAGGSSAGTVADEGKSRVGGCGVWVMVMPCMMMMMMVMKKNESDGNRISLPLLHKVYSYT
jgi:hypothetical protein